MTFRLWIAAALAAAVASRPAPAMAAATLELYGTLESMGVIVTIDTADDPDGDAVAAVEYARPGDAYRAAFTPDRVAPTRFVGSLFQLTAGTAYDVRVTLSDPDGGPLEGVVLAGSQTTRPEVTAPAPLRSLFASPSGTGTACNRTTPCALTQALAQVAAGDEVVLLPGTYSGGAFPVRSGAPGAPIVIRGDAPGTAVLDGADPTTFTWTAQGGGVYHATINVGGPQVHADGQRLFPYASLADLQNLIWSLPGFFASGTDLYVRLPGDADPGGARMEVARENVGFTLAAGVDHVYFIDLVLQNYGGGGYPKAIYFNGGSEALVRGCIFRQNSTGIGIKRGSGRLLIEQNDFSDSKFLWSWNASKASGLLETSSIVFFDPVTGRGIVIRRNVMRDSFDGVYGAPEAEAGDPTNETDISDNYIHHMGDDGMSIDGAASNVRIWGNRLHDVLVGISLAPNYVGPTYVLRNVIHTMDTGNNQWPGSPLKLNSGFDGSGVMYFLHNTVDVVSPATNSLHIVSPGDWTKLVVRNNILSATQYVIRNGNETQPADLDYDCMYTTYIDFGSWNGLGVFPTLAAFQAATGKEANGLFAPPDFVSPASGNYTLLATSGCIDRAVRLPGINDGFTGAGPDMGAFEYAGACTPVPPAGSIGNAVTAVKRAAGAVEVAWASATVTPPNHAVFRTDRADQIAETPGGIGDETLLGVTAATSLVDPAAGTSVPCWYYAVLPADSCNGPVFP